MQLSFKDRVLLEVVDQLEELDLVFTQRLNSFSSWAMMYFSSSSIDHVALYAGDGKVVHMTLEGGKRHSIQALAKGARVLPLRLGKIGKHYWVQETNHEQSLVNKETRRSHSFPPKLQLVWIGIRIVSGFHPSRFRWKFAADLATLFALFELISRSAFGFSSGLWMLLLYAFVAAGNLARFKLEEIRGRTPANKISHPDIGYRAFFKVGGMMFTTMGPLVVCELGILPLNVLLRFSRKSSDDGSDDDFEEARKFFSNIVEDLNLGEVAEKCKDNDCDEHN